MPRLYTTTQDVSPYYASINKSLDFGTRVRPVVIEDCVFIGTRAMILPGVTLHQGSVVAAGAVVSRDVQAKDIVGGIPARSIGTRRAEIKYLSDEYSRFLH